MADTQPPEAPSILDSLTREELVEAILLREHERDAFHDANTAAVKIAAFNLRGWRTALARAERAEGRAEELFGELEEAKQQREDAETERNCQAATHEAEMKRLHATWQHDLDALRVVRAQAATDAATIAELQASLAVMTNDRDHLMKSATTATPPAAPDGARTTPYPPLDAEISFVGNVAVVNFVERPPPALRPFDAACASARKYSGQTKPEPKFKAGQRVRFVSKVASAHDGAVGTIVTVRPDGLFVVGFQNWMLDGCYAEDQLAPEGAQP